MNTNQDIDTSPLNREEPPHVSKRSRWNIRIIALIGCVFFLIVAFRALSCRPSAAANLHALDTLPEAHLVPSGAQIGDRTFRDASCSIESPQLASIYTKVTTATPPAAIMAFYDHELKSYGWRILDKDPDDYRWYKGRRLIQIRIIDQVPTRAEDPQSQRITHYNLAIWDSKGK